MEQSRNHLYRVDRFAVPPASLAEFLSLVEGTHEVLRAQAGFLRDMVLEQVAGPGRFNVTTLAEWRDQPSYDAAVEAVQRHHAAIGFDRTAMAGRLGIKADIAVYRRRGATGDRMHP